MNGIGAFVASSARERPSREQPKRTFRDGRRHVFKRHAAWQLFAALGAIAATAYFFLPPLPQALLYAAFGIAAGITIIVATRSNRSGRAAWFLFAGTQLLWAVGDLIWSGHEFLLHEVAPYPSVADWLYLAGYPLSLIGIALHVKKQATGPRRFVFMDAAMLAMLVGLITWQGFIRPYITEARLLTSGDIVGLAYPLMDLALFSVSAALLLGAGGRKTSNRLMVAAIGAAFFADVMYGAGAFDGTYHSGIWYDAGWLVSYVLWGVAALHPSSRYETVGESPGVPRAHFRLLLYSSLILMGVLIVDLIRGIPISLFPLAIGGVSVFALVVVRMQGLTAELHARLMRAQESEQALRRSEERFRTAFESSAAGMVLTSLSGEFLQVNRTFAEMVGWSYDELVGRSYDALTHAEDRAPSAETVKRLATGETDEAYLENRLVHRDGRPVWVSVSLGLIRDELGAPRSIVAHAVDQSRAKELEDSLSRSQKMEAVGQLAGGIAHDFNNLLSVIQNYTRFVHDDLKPGDPNREDLGEVLKAGQRGANLVHQLLTFSRRERTSPQVLDINELIGNISNLLRKSLRESVVLRLDLTSTTPHVEIDPTQMEQILLNLALNARDAMPIGGELVVGTKVVGVRSTDAALGLPEGEYVLLRVSDNGCGMPEAVRARIFEPFFTTKERGAGTGLGLATVYGSVTRSGGTVIVDSEPGFGTRFDIYLPRVTPAALAGDDKEPDAGVPAGTERILVVEDEEGIRRIVKRVLERNGYEVLVAESPPQAVDLAARSSGRIDVLLTDVVMPQLSGPEVASRIRLSHPEIRVLYMSGYTDDVMAQHGIVTEIQDYLPKPFTAEDLLQRVRERLDDVLAG